MKTRSLVEEINCYQCRHRFVCYMLKIVRDNNLIHNEAPAQTLFFAVPANIGAVCLYHQKERNEDKE